MEKEYKNKTEQGFAKFMQNDGYQTTKRGIPDFLCWKGNEIIFVEVKPRGNHRLSQRQCRAIKVLMKAGIKCFRYDADLGLQAITTADLNRESRSYLKKR